MDLFHMPVVFLFPSPLHMQDIIHTLMERTPVQHDIVEIVAAMNQVN
jgi:hypothetical protein